MKPIDQFLYWYTLGLSTILTLNAITAIRTPSQLLTLALLLPVPLYTALQGIKRLFLWRQLLVESGQYQSTPTEMISPRFSMRTFFTQRHPLFLATLFLYALLLMTILIKQVMLP